MEDNIDKHCVKQVQSWAT